MAQEATDIIIEQLPWHFHWTTTFRGELARDWDRQRRWRVVMEAGPEGPGHESRWSKRTRSSLKFYIIGSRTWIRGVASVRWPFRAKLPNAKPNW